MVLKPLLAFALGTPAMLEVSGHGHLREIAEVLQQHKHMRTDNFIEFLLLVIRLRFVFSPVLPVRLDLIFA